MAMVIDASVTMAWCFENESTAATDQVLDQLVTDSAIVPALWRLEVANVLVVAERRKRITEAQGTHFLNLLEQLPIEVDLTPPDSMAHLDLARRHGLSAYDASYLMLSMALDAPMATIDHRLAAACRSAGVPLVIAD